MAEATTSTKMPSREVPDLRDLEGPIMDVVQMTRIADTLVSYSLALQKGERYGEHYRRFVFSEEEIGDLLFMLGEARHRAQLLSEAFYGRIEGGAA